MREQLEIYDRESKARNSTNNEKNRDTLADVENKNH